MTRNYTFPFTDKHIFHKYVIFSDDDEGHIIYLTMWKNSDTSGLSAYKTSKYQAKRLCTHIYDIQTALWYYGIVYHCKSTSVFRTELFLYSCSLFLQSFSKKLDNGVRVPLIYAQSLHNNSLVIQQLDEWVRAPHVPHFQAGKSERIISLHKC